MNMDGINFGYIPSELRGYVQWVMWSTQDRDGKPTKVPLRTDGGAAKSNDPSTWSTFEAVKNRLIDGGNWSGIGFMFSADDPFCGIDLDGCRDPQTGAVAEWAKEIILKFGSYAEVSPSQTGVKIFCRAENPLGGGKKIQLQNVPKTGEKAPAIEVYDRLRYFAVTGWRLANCHEIRDAGDAIQWLKSKHWPAEPDRPQLDFKSDGAVIERARKYLARLPPSISGQNGHGAAFHGACVLVIDFEIDEQNALALMHEFNAGCEPKWSDRELAHKVRQAMKQPGQRGRLRYAAQANWQRIPVPEYKEPLPKKEPRCTTLVDAARQYVQSIREGRTELVGTSVPDLDYALSGGVQFGEMVIFAARPSHGKSAMALQCLHHWTEKGLPCLMISEEMSALMLGRRSLQFLSATPEEHWELDTVKLESQIDAYASVRKSCIIVEGCGTTEAACEAVEKAVADKGVRCAVVDYAQLLRSPGKDRYQQVTNTSLMLRALASATKIVLLVLCQLSRGVEQRKGEFLPVMSDLKDTGQLEQDADTIVFLCWPHRIDQTQPVNKYQFFISKNRNRAIKQGVVDCRFMPDRQMVLDSVPEMPSVNERERSF